MNDASKVEDDEATPGEAARYLYDMADQLAEMARRYGLHKTADALAAARRAAESEF